MVCVYLARMGGCVAMAEAHVVGAGGGGGTDGSGVDRRVRGQRIGQDESHFLDLRFPWYPLFHGSFIIPPCSANGDLSFAC